MGRYYSGDIDGKFWFAVQSSDAANRFGVNGHAPQLIEYYFDEENLEEITKELEVIEKNLGEYKTKMDKFFDENDSYNDERLAKEIGTTEEKVKELLSEYADYELGKKIKECVEETGQCGFEGET